MTRQYGVIICALWVLAFKNFSYAQELMPIEEIRSGMSGKTHTVIRGSEIIELDTEILGVMWNYLGPDKHVILGRLVDERTALSGAVHGMSGSPLYIGGKLVGALAYRVGTFEKDGHCGFTPIKDMLDVNALKAIPRDVSVFHTSRFNLISDFTHSITKLDKPKQQHMEYLGLPFSITGWKSEFNHLLDKIFPDMPLMLASTGGVSLEDDKVQSYPLEAGSALAAVFVSGDITMAGTGTLTWRKGDRVLGFGHPMLGLGEVQLPMASAEILSILPSYFRPFKIANTGKMSGTITQDRTAAIAGKIGKLPEMGTYKIKRQWNGVSQETLEGGFAKHRALTPQLILMIMIQSMILGDELSDEVSLRLEGKLGFKDYPSLILDGVYSGTRSERMSALFDQGFTIMNLVNEYAYELDITSLELDVKTLEQASVWEIEKVVLDPPVIRSDQKIEAVITLRNLAGEREVQRFSFELPEHIKDGQVGIYVGGGDVLEGSEKRKGALSLARDARDRIYSLNKQFQADHLYLRLYTNDLGARVRQRDQTGLPYSVLSVMGKNAAAKPALQPLSRKVWFDQARKIDGVIRGGKVVEAKVKKGL
ncbi:MAG: hypothetical protein AAGA18_07045 [Verrucomicrobiota bacterium]